MPLLGYITGIGYGCICLVLSLILYKLGIPKKYTRKVVHILIGFEWVFLYTFMGAGIHFLAVCIFFTALLAVAYKGNLMPMISSDGDNAPGTVYYGIAMTGVAAVAIFVPELMLPFGVGIFCTSIGDGLAGLVGQAVRKYNPAIYGKKTLFGTLANLAFSFASTIIMSTIFEMGLSVWHALAIAFLSSSLELVTGFGLDNIVITWGVTALTYSFMYTPTIGNYIVPILLTPAVIAFALGKRALTPMGVVLAIVMDVAVSVALGNFGFVLLIAFFGGSVLIDKIKRRAKRGSTDDVELKGDRRDHMQVIANGLIPTLAALMYLFTDKAVFVIAFVASLSEAFADTAASGVGAFAKKTYDPFKLRVTEHGLSGGMSWIGTLASLIAAFAIGMVAFAFKKLDFDTVLLTTVAAFLGGVFDSFLGSVFQIKFKCRLCGKITEKHEHCGERTVRHSGLALIDNDVVNLMGGLFAAALSITLFYAII